MKVRAIGIYSCLVPSSIPRPRVERPRSGLGVRGTTMVDDAELAARRAPQDGAGGPARDAGLRQVVTLIIPQTGIT